MKCRRDRHGTNIQPMNAKTLRKIAIHTISCLMLSHGSVAIAQNLGANDEETLRQLYGGEEMIRIATGSMQPLAKAPAVTTVITAENIKAMGATDLDEVLETIPGLHVARNAFGYNPIYTIRGIYSDFNPQILLLINGIPITNLFVGDRNLVWGGMPVQAIARIEVIRGPGSAVYGADAFAGVINIITKTNQDLKGTEVGGRVGSFDTWDGWVLSGNKWADFDVAAMVEYHDTNGQSRIIGADAQTAFDDLNGTQASRAPGSVNLQRENLDARIDISRGYWQLRAGLQRRTGWGTGAGLAQALDPKGRFASDRWNADLTYHNPTFTENWDLTTQLSYFDTSQEVERNVFLFPPGGLPGFPDGVIGNPEVFERHARFNVSGFYAGFDRHLLRVGTGFNYGNIYKVRESKNYSQASLASLVPLGHMVDVSDTSAVFLAPGDRKNYFFFLQDEWSFANDWELTTGVRYDHYSDFGDTVNPRLALVWETRYDLTTKLLYGRAFRAPSFAETRGDNNPANLGNPNLNPETIQTLELAFDHRPTDDLHLGLGLFGYIWDDIIQFKPDPGSTTRTAQNAGKQVGYGMELEVTWRPDPTVQVIGNYAFQKSIDETLDADAGNAPRHHIYLRTEWEFLPDWELSPQLNWIADRNRVKTDNRPPVDDYALVDLTLRRKKLLDHWEVAFSVRNLFNADAREPSPAGNPTIAIPYDLPLPGRSFFGEIRYRF
jgi:outer membrane receptor protein involved in Fe transport